MTSASESKQVRWTEIPSDPNCSTCGGDGKLRKACPDGRAGCAVAHYRRCHTCRPEPHAPDMYCGCVLCAAAIEEILDQRRSG